MDLQSYLTTENIAYAVFAILAIVVAIFLIKRAAGCIIRTVLFIIALAIMAYIYLNYIHTDKEQQEKTTDIESVE